MARVTSLRSRGGWMIAGLATILLAAIAGAGTLAPPAASAAVPSGAVAFDDTTDTIMVDGQTVLATDSTYEAQLFFPSGANGFGHVFNEWTDFQEDKLLLAGTSTVQGFNFGTTGGILTASSLTLTEDAWHHVAFVQDSAASEHRLYIDGALVASGASTGNISDGAGLAFIGAIFRDSTTMASFLGYIDSLRISDNARYSGASFSAPSGDLPDDANTLLLYNFNTADFFIDGTDVRINDLSGNSRTGTLGTGFGGATSPTLPPGVLPTATPTNTSVAAPTSTSTPVATGTSAANGGGSTGAAKTATPTRTSTSTPAAAAPAVPATAPSGITGPSGAPGGVGTGAPAGVALPDTGAGASGDPRERAALVAAALALLALLVWGAGAAARRR